MSNSKSNNKRDQDEENDKTVASELFDYINEQVRELFTDNHGTPFAAIQVNGHQEIIPIKSGKFKKLIIKYHYDNTGNPVRSEVLNQVCDLFQAKATFEGNQRDLQIRAHYDKDSNTIYIDLTNRTWQIIKITNDEWTIENSEDMPIMFTRYSNQIAQVEPSRDYPENIFDQFMNLLNIKTEDHKILLKCYMVTLLIGHIAKAILILHGEQNAAKSCCHEIIKDVIDPSVIKTLVIPRDNNELIQQLSHNYLAYYDNVSYLRNWTSDQLCRAVTGSGSSKRELYSDDDDIIYQFMRGIGLNGIHLAASKADLLDRSIIILLERIDKNDQLPKEDILTELKLLKPKLLGYICDLLTKVLDVITNGGIKLKSRSRMADFEEYAEIVSRCMGYPEGKFIEIYQENQRLQTETVIEGNPIATCIIRMMDDDVRRKYGWSGTATELLDILEKKAFDLKINTTDKLWPKGANALSYRLNEIRTSLRQSDVEINYERDGNKKGSRIITIRIRSSEPSDRQKSQNHAQNEGQTSDDPHDDVTNVEGSLQRSSEILVQKHARKQISDDHDDHDDHIRTPEYERLENATYEFNMGLYQTHGIIKLGSNWNCKGERCTIKGHDKFAAYVHVDLNHVVPEVKDKLGVLKGFDSDTRTQELRRMNMNQLQLLASHVEHNSTLEKAILEAIDYNHDGGRI